MIMMRTEALSRIVEINLNAQRSQNVISRDDFSSLRRIQEMTLQGSLGSHQLVADAIKVIENIGDELCSSPDQLTRAAGGTVWSIALEINK